MNELVKQYYGETLQGTKDLKTDACCTEAAPPEFARSILAKIHHEVMERHYGCGLIVPEHLEGLSILDLGCGSGRDAYLLSRLVGPQGSVIGVDMTDRQLAIARRHIEFHRKAFGYQRSNIQFLHGYIEQLDKLPIPADSVDLVVSNCVINLSADKAAVLRQVRHLLKPGGEMYFSDIYADRRVPERLRQDPVLYGECLSGALYWNDFLTLAVREGFADPRLISDRPIRVENPELSKRLGNIRFFSATYRLFKLPDLEPSCEDYGQAVIYLGTIPHHPDRFVLDKHHAMEKGRVFPVCGNSWRMLKETRFAPHFEFIGDFNRHYGLFTGCGGGLPFDQANGAPANNACC